MYGENAFTIRPAVFQSDIDKAKKAKQARWAAGWLLCPSSGAPPSWAPFRCSSPLRLLVLLHLRLVVMHIAAMCQPLMCTTPMASCR